MKKLKQQKEYSDLQRQQGQWNVVDYDPSSEKFIHDLYNIFLSPFTGNRYVKGRLFMGAKTVREEKHK